MTPFVQQLCEESKELATLINTIEDRHSSLSKYIEQRRLDDKEQTLISAQLEHMEAAYTSLFKYREVVDRRIRHGLGKYTIDSPFIEHNPY